jgi:hypothetical protein
MLTLKRGFAKDGTKKARSEAHGQETQIPEIAPAQPRMGKTDPHHFLRHTALQYQVQAVRHLAHAETG